MGFTKEAVAMFIAAVGILSVVAQTGLLALLMKTVGSKHTIMVGLLFEMLQVFDVISINLKLTQSMKASLYILKRYKNDIRRKCICLRIPYFFV